MKFPTTPRPRQSALAFDQGEPQLDTRSLPDAFRRLYYHLYSNSRATRSERIIEDLSLLLLTKLATESNGGADVLESLQRRGGSPNKVLIPLLRKTYPGLVDEKQRFSLGDDAVLGAIQTLESVRLSVAPAHVIGEAFQALIGPRLRGDKGQFFTPRSLVRAVVRILAPRPNESVLDPACGTGGFLMEAHAFQAEVAAREGGSVTGNLVGVDKDHDLFRLASALMQVASRGRARVHNLDSLNPKDWAGLSTNADGCLFDLVLTNPPFGAKIGIKDPALLSSYSLGHQWVNDATEGWVETPSVLGTQDPQILFVELCVRKLKPGGRLGIVLPEGLFGNSRDGYIWKWLASQGRVFALLDCPRTTFQPGTDVKTNVLFFEAYGEGSVPTPKGRDQAYIGVAINCGHDRRGRSHFSDGRPLPDDFAELSESYAQREVEKSNWISVSLPEAGYLVPRYYAEVQPLTKQEADLTTGARLVTLRHLVTQGVLVIRKGDEVGSDAYGTGDVPFVRTSDISNFEVSTDPTKAVSEEIYEQYAKQQALKAEDLLIAVDGRYRIGATAMLTDRNVRCVVQSHLRIISVEKPDVIDPYELLFALSLPSVRLRIRDLVFVQSTLGTLGRRLYELKIPLLHGDGPWRQRVEQFRRVVQERDRLLAELTSLDQAFYEL